jgi:anaerobic selenocysteine-containing dehydrogenase
VFRDVSFADLGPHAPLPARHPYVAPDPATTPDHTEETDGPLRLHRYRPLFSGPVVERVAELGFQRPGREVELSGADAESRGIVDGDAVVVRSNGTSVELRARVNKRLIEGVARIAEEHAGDLHPAVEVTRP